MSIDPDTLAYRIIQFKYEDRQLDRRLDYSLSKSNNRQRGLRIWQQTLRIYEFAGHHDGLRCIKRSAVHTQGRPTTIIQ